MPTVFQDLEAARAALAKAEARAVAAEVGLWDGYMKAVLMGLCAGPQGRYDNRQAMIDDAEQIVLKALRARARYKAGLSPNMPPKPQLQPQKNGATK